MASFAQARRAAQTCWPRRTVRRPEDGAATGFDGRPVLLR